MSTTARLFRTARPCCDVKHYGLSVKLKVTSRSVASFRRVPGLGEQTPWRDTAEGNSLRTAHTSPERRTRSESKDAHVTTTDPYVIGRDGRRYDFYEYFLQYRKPPRPPIPSPWIVSLDLHPKSLPTELAQDPLRVFDDTRADVKLTKLCLQTFVARAHRDYGNGTQAREMYKSTKIGSRALLWFLDHAFETVDIVLDPDWPELLAHCLVAQDDTYTVLCHWLTVNHTPKYADVWDPKEQNRWRARTFRAAIQSIVYWTKDLRVGTSDALKFFNYVVGKATETIRVPYFGAATQLTSYLTSFDTSKVEVTQLEKFMWHMRLWAPRGSLARSWETARLLLNHPTGPQPEAALQLFLHVDANRKDFFQTRDAPFNLAVQSAIMRTAQVLDDMGRKQDARRILRIGRDRLPTYFFACKVTDTNRDRLDPRGIARVFGDSYAETTGRLRVLQDQSQTQRAIRMEMLRNR